MYECSSSGPVFAVTSKGSRPSTANKLHIIPISTTTIYSTTTPVATSASTPVPVATKTTFSTTTPVVSSTSTPVSVTTSQQVCQDQALCSDPHMKQIACGDLYLSKNYCPKMCHMCGEFCFRGVRVSSMRKFK